MIMTKTALANREMRSRERIAYADRVAKSEIARKDRNLQREEGEKNRRNKLIEAGIGSVGRLGGSALKLFNDPSWYKNYIKDLDEFVKVPTFDRLGSQKFYHEYISYGTNDYTVPGIMVFDYIPTCGPQENSGAHFRNAVNQSLARTKEKVLALNSRSSVNWEASDLGLNIFCSASLVAMLCDLRRAIMVYQTYHAKNAYLARALLESLGWSWAEFVAHYADYRKFYVMMATRFNTTIVAPISESIYSRKIYLNSNIFVDTDEKGYVRQMYAFRYDRYFDLNDATPNAHLLKPTRNSYATFTSEVQLAFEHIASSPDFLEMYQDLRHAFGDKIVQLPEDVKDQAIEFNDVALNREQIHNIMLAPIGFNKAGAYKASTYAEINWRLRVDTNGYLYQGGANDARDRKFTWAGILTGLSTTGVSTFIAEMENYYGTGFNQLINMHKEHVSGDDILDITRGMFSATIPVVPLPTDDLDLMITGCGTEVFFGSKVYVYQSINDTLSSHNVSTFVIQNIGDTVEIPAITVVYSLASAFSWAPILRLTQFDFANEGVHSKHTFCDAYTTFEVSRSTIYKIHSAAVMSELYVEDSNYVK